MDPISNPTEKRASTEVLWNVTRTRMTDIVIPTMLKTESRQPKNSYGFDTNVCLEDLLYTYDLEDSKERQKEQNYSDCSKSTLLLSGHPGQEEDYNFVKQRIEIEFNDIEENEIARLEALLDSESNQSELTPSHSAHSPINPDEDDSSSRNKYDFTLHADIVSHKQQSSALSFTQLPTSTYTQSQYYRRNPTYSSQNVTQVSPNAKVETCFRIGEAINFGARSLRENQDVLIELYARVQSSLREKMSSKQLFRLMDLQHDRPPYLNAVYELWKTDSKGDQESRVFLPYVVEKKICRCLGRMQRDPKQKLILVLLNVWQINADNLSYEKRLHCRR
jgi:hypothetical protein